MNKMTVKCSECDCETVRVLDGSHHCPRCDQERECESLEVRGDHSYKRFAVNGKYVRCCRHCGHPESPLNRGYATALTLAKERVDGCKFLPSYAYGGEDGHYDYHDDYDDYLASDGNVYDAGVENDYVRYDSEERLPDDPSKGTGLLKVTPKLVRRIRKEERRKGRWSKDGKKFITVEEHGLQQRKKRIAERARLNERLGNAREERENRIFRPTLECIRAALNTPLKDNRLSNVSRLLHDLDSAVMQGSVHDNDLNAGRWFTCGEIRNLAAAAVYFHFKIPWDRTVGSPGSIFPDVRRQTASGEWLNLVERFEKPPEEPPDVPDEPSEPSSVPLPETAGWWDRDPNKRFLRVGVDVNDRHLSILWRLERKKKPHPADVSGVKFVEPVRPSPEYREEA